MRLRPTHAYSTQPVSFPHALALSYRVSCIDAAYRRIIEGPAVRYLVPTQHFGRTMKCPYTCTPVPYPCTYCTIPLYLPYRTHVPTAPNPCFYRTVPTPLRTVPVCVLHRPYRNKPSILPWSLISLLWNKDNCAEILTRMSFIESLRRDLDKQILPRGPSKCRQGCTSNLKMSTAPRHDESDLRGPKWEGCASTC